MSEPFSYCIPLRPRNTAANWSRVEQLLGAAIATALAGDDIRIVVAGTDEPDIAQLSDPRVTFVQTAAMADQMADKQNKKQVALYTAAAAVGPGLYMYLDADDHVHRDLPRYVRGVDGAGVVITKGYEFHVGDRLYWELGDFHLYCGTCAVFRFEQNDLPKQLGDSGCYASRFRNHAEWKVLAEEAGRPLVPSRMLGALYAIANGENHSSRMGHPSRKRQIYRLLVPGRRVDAELLQAFPGLVHLTE